MEPLLWVNIIIGFLVTCCLLVVIENKRQLALKLHDVLRMQRDALSKFDGILDETKRLAAEITRVAKEVSEIAKNSDSNAIALGALAKKIDCLAEVVGPVPQKIINEKERRDLEDRQRIDRVARETRKLP